MASGRVKEIDDLFEQQETERVDLWESTATDDQIAKDFLAAAPSGQGRLSWGDDLVEFMSTGSSSQTIPAPAKANESMWDDFLGLSQMPVPSSAPITHEINFNDDLREFFVHSPVAQKAVAYDFISLESPLNATKKDDLSQQDQPALQAIEPKDALVGGGNTVAASTGIFNTLQEAKPSEVNPLDSIVFNTNPMPTTETMDDAQTLVQERMVDVHQEEAEVEITLPESTTTTGLEQLTPAQEDSTNDAALASTNVCFSIDDYSQEPTPQAAEESFNENYEAIQEACVAPALEETIPQAVEKSFYDNHDAVQDAYVAPTVEEFAHQTPLESSCGNHEALQDTHAAPVAEEFTPQVAGESFDDNYEEDTHAAPAEVTSRGAVAFTPSEIASNMATEDSHSVYQDLLSPTSTDIHRDNALEAYDNLSLSDYTETRHDGIITLDDDDETTATESFPTETVDSSSSASSPAGTSFFSFINTAQEGGSLDGDANYDPMMTPTGGGNSYEENSFHPQEDQIHQYEQEEGYFSSPAALECTNHRASDAESSNSSENRSTQDVHYDVDDPTQLATTTESESVPYASSSNLDAETTGAVLSTNTDLASFSIDDAEEERHEWTGSSSFEMDAITTTTSASEPTTKDPEQNTLEASEQVTDVQVSSSDTTFSDANTEFASHSTAEFVPFSDADSSQLELTQEEAAFTSEATQGNSNVEITPEFSASSHVDAINDQFEFNEEQEVVPSTESFIQPTSTEGSFAIAPPTSDAGTNPWLQTKNDEFEFSDEQNVNPLTDSFIPPNATEDSFVITDASESASNPWLQAKNDEFEFNNVVTSTAANFQTNPTSDSFAIEDESSVVDSNPWLQVKNDTFELNDPQNTTTLTDTNIEPISSDDDFVIESQSSVAPSNPWLTEEKSSSTTTNDNPWLGTTTQPGDNFASNPWLQSTSSTKEAQTKSTASDTWGFDDKKVDSNPWLTKQPAADLGNIAPSSSQIAAAHAVAESVTSSWLTSGARNVQKKSDNLDDNFGDFAKVEKPNEWATEPPSTGWTSQPPTTSWTSAPTQDDFGDFGEQSDDFEGFSSFDAPASQTATNFEAFGSTGSQQTAFSSTPKKAMTAAELFTAAFPKASLPSLSPYSTVTTQDVLGSIDFESTQKPIVCSALLDPLTFDLRSNHISIDPALTKDTQAAFALKQSKLALTQKVQDAVVRNELFTENSSSYAEYQGKLCSPDKTEILNALYQLQLALFADSSTKAMLSIAEQAALSAQASIAEQSKDSGKSSSLTRQFLGWNKSESEEAKAHAASLRVLTPTGASISKLQRTSFVHTNPSSNGSEGNSGSDIDAEWETTSDGGTEDLTPGARTRTASGSMVAIQLTPANASAGLMKKFSSKLGLTGLRAGWSKPSKVATLTLRRKGDKATRTLELQLDSISGGFDEIKWKCAQFLYDADEVASIAPSQINVMSSSGQVLSSKTDRGAVQKLFKDKSCVWTIDIGVSRESTEEA